MFLGLIVVAIVSSLIRFWLIPALPTFRESLQEAARGRLGHPLEIGHLSARMAGFQAEAVLDDVVLHAESGGSVLKLGEIRARIDLPRSLWRGRPVLTDLTLTRADLALRRAPDGRWSVLGFEGPGVMPTWLPTDGKCSFHAIRVALADAEGKLSALARLDGDLWLEPGTLRVHADVSLHEALGGQIRFDGEFARDAEGQPALSAARTYLEAGGLKPPLLDLLGPLAVTGRAGMADGRVWADWSGGLIRRAVGELRLDKPLIDLSAEDGRRGSLALVELSSRFAWRTDGSLGHLDLSELRLGVFETAKRPLTGSLRFRDGKLEAFAATELPLDSLRVLADALPILPAEAQPAVRAIAPRGVLRNVSLIVAPSGNLAKVGVRAAFESLQLKPYREWPGVSGLSGEIEGSGRRGVLDLSIADGSVSAPNLWRNRLPIDRCSTRIVWDTVDGSVFGAGSLNDFSAPGIGRLSAQMAWSQPVTGQTGGRNLSIRAEGGDIALASLRTYLPLAAMKPIAADWLGGAFDAGTIDHLRVLFRGDPDAFPFRAHDGVFQAAAAIHGLELDFDPSWPHGTEVAGTVWFDGPGMTIEANGGRLGETTVDRVTATVADLVKDDWLDLQGKVRGSITAALAVLSASPLREIPLRLQSLAKVAGGETDVRLQLKIPIVTGVTAVGVQGEADLKHGALWIPSIDQTVEAINGTLRFSGNQLRGEAIRAHVLGEPAQIAVNRANDTLAVDIESTVTGRTLDRWLPAKFDGLLAGQTHYRVGFAIPDGPAAAHQPLRIALESDMSGLGVRLPAPFEKPPNARRKLRAELAVRDRGPVPLHIDYGNILGIRSVLEASGDGWVMRSGQISVGETHAPVASAGGVALAVDLDEFDVNAWRAFVAESESGDGRLGDQLERVDLNIGRLRVGQETFANLRLRATRNGELWAGDLNGSVGRGRFEWSRPEFGRSAILLDFDELRVRKANDSAPETAAVPEPDPAQLPALTLKSKQTLWNGYDLGALEFVAESWTAGWNIKTLKLSARGRVLDAKGSWFAGPEGATSRLQGSLKIAGVGTAAAEAGYGSAVHETPADVAFTLKWPGGPARLNARDLSGEVKVRFGKGALLHVEPGLGRVLGMINFDSLSRRLRLDFSDLFGKGLAYDGVEGHLQIGRGQAVTEGLLIDALSAKILISGRAGLVDRDLDLRVAVIPDTDVALPIAGTLAGGPAVGAAVFLAQRLAGEQVDRITASHYSITGPWRDPVVADEPGFMPMDVLNRAWTGLKSFSGLQQQEDKKP